MLLYYNAGTVRLHKQVPFIGCLGRERHWNGPPSLPASAQDINVFPPKRAWNNQKGYFILDNHMAANHVLTTIWPKTWFPLIPLIKCCLSSGVKVCALKTTAWLYPSGYCSKQIIYNKNFGPKCVFNIFICNIQQLWINEKENVCWAVP